MLVQFLFENFKCFKDETKLSLVASRHIKENEDNVIKSDTHNLLKTVVIYGPNASGKTKLLNAFQFMRLMVERSTNNAIDKDFSIDPFRLNTETKESPSFFEVVFILNEIQYRYGFELTRKKILAEWLYKKGDKETELFYREGKDINFDISELKRIKSLVEEDMIREDSLLLTVLAQFNDQLSQKIVKWFHHVNMLSADGDTVQSYTLDKLTTPMKQKIVRLMKDADFSINDFVRHPINKNEIQTLHTVYDENKLRVAETPFLLEEESNGTIHFLSLTAPILDTLERGKILLIDELDSGLHHDLIVALLKLFHSKETNPHNAQLIFNTQNTNLLSGDLFRKDQIYFVSKNRYGEATLSSAADFMLRSGVNLQKKYLEGRLGAVPYLKNMPKSFTTKKEEENDENGD